MTTGANPAVSHQPASTRPDGRRGGGRLTGFLVCALPQCSLNHFIPRSLLRGLIVVGRVPLGMMARGVGCVPRAGFACARVGSRRRVRVRRADAVARCRCGTLVLEHGVSGAVGSALGIPNSRVPTRPIKRFRPDSPPCLGTREPAGQPASDGNLNGADRSRSEPT
jgi:hypothetical protein